MLRGLQTLGVLALATVVSASLCVQCPATLNSYPAGQPPAPVVEAYYAEVSGAADEAVCRVEGTDGFRACRYDVYTGQRTRYVAFDYDDLGANAGGSMTEIEYEHYTQECPATLPQFDSSSPGAVLDSLTVCEGCAEPARQEEYDNYYLPSYYSPPSFPFEYTGPTDMRRLRNCEDAIIEQVPNVCALMGYGQDGSHAGLALVAVVAAESNNCPYSTALTWNVPEPSCADLSGSYKLIKSGFAVPAVFGPFPSLPDESTGLCVARTWCCVTSDAIDPTTSDPSTCEATLFSLEGTCGVVNHLAGLLGGIAETRACGKFNSFTQATLLLSTAVQAIDTLVQGYLDGNFLNAVAKVYVMLAEEAAGAILGALSLGSGLGPYLAALCASAQLLVVADVVCLGIDLDASCPDLAREKRSVLAVEAQEPSVEEHAPATKTTLQERQSTFTACDQFLLEFESAFGQDACANVPPPLDCSTWNLESLTATFGAQQAQQLVDACPAYAATIDALNFLCPVVSAATTLREIGFCDPDNVPLDATDLTPSARARARARRSIALPGVADRASFW